MNEITLTLSNIILLFATMVMLAALPSSSVLAVTSRSIASGFKHGFFVAMGIVIGDITFVIVAIIGLSVIINTLGSMLIVLKYACAACLLWFGYSLWQPPSLNINTSETVDNSLSSSFLCGLLLTLGDYKAVIFYIGLLPAYINLKNISFIDTSILISIVIASVGSVKVAYAWVADKANYLFVNNEIKKAAHIIVGSLMIITAIYLVIQT